MTKFRNRRWHYLAICVFPRQLCPDWSGSLIDLIYPERDLRGNLKGPGHPDYYHDHKKVLVAFKSKPRTHESIFEARGFFQLHFKSKYIAKFAS